MAEQAVRATCPYCGVGCGLRVRPRPEGGWQVEGDPDHPANRGRICSKGAALAETLGTRGRLLHPRVRGRRVGWGEALDEVARGLARIVETHGPEAVAFYVSGQLLTEDYYVANKLMKGFLGAANIDSNSRLCMSSAVAAHRRTFGEDVVPVGYDDLEEADLVVLVGSNLAWCHPVLYRRIEAARRRRGGRSRLVVIDPRRTESCAEAELHLPVAPGTDAVLFLGLLAYLAERGMADAGFVARHVTGVGEALAAAREEAPDVAAVARRCGLEAEAVARFYRLWAAHGRTVTVFSQGVNQSGAGTDAAGAIIDCHLFTGRIGRPGTGPFSVTGQPNAMGGREVGAMADRLAARLGFAPEEVALAARFWGSHRVARAPGPKAVEMFERIADGSIRAVWILATNPVVSLPAADAVREALARCELVVVSECFETADTAAVADVCLPAAAWGEKDGTVTNSERRISRQRPFLRSPGEARPDWWMLTEVARRMGYGAAFPYRHPAEIFREHAALTALAAGRRLLDLGALAGLDRAGYDALEPVRWPLEGGRPFADGRFPTPDGRARMVPVRHRPREVPPPTLVLNTGRVRDQWHTMTRTARAARLNAHTPEPCLEVHPDDAVVLGLDDGGLAEVRSRYGSALLRVRLDSGQRRGSVFAPMHWGARFSGRARIGAVVEPVTDPLSGQPALKQTRVAVAPRRVRWHALAFVAADAAPPEVPYWTRSAGAGHECWHMAGEAPFPWREWLAGAGVGGEWIELRDPGRGILRLACVAGGRLRACVFVGPRPPAADRAWVGGLFAAPVDDGAGRAALLAGGPKQAGGRRGAVICACVGVDEATILRAVTEGCTTPEAVTARCGAGSGCGSCLPAIRRLLAGTVRGAA